MKCFCTDFVPISLQWKRMCIGRDVDGDYKISNFPKQAQSVGFNGVVGELWVVVCWLSEEIGDHRSLIKAVFGGKHLQVILIHVYVLARAFMLGFVKANWKQPLSGPRLTRRGKVWSNLSGDRGKYQMSSAIFIFSGFLAFIDSLVLCSTKSSSSASENATNFHIVYGSMALSTLKSENDFSMLCARPSQK